MTVKDMIHQYLVEHGYDGLFNDFGECACLRGELAPCDQSFVDCEPGYLQAGSTELDFVIGPRPAEIEEEDV